MVRAGFRMLLAGEPDIDVTHVLQKFGLRDRVQAVVLAHRTGLVDGRPLPRGDG